TANQEILDLELRALIVRFTSEMCTKGSHTVDHRKENLNSDEAVSSFGRRDLMKLGGAGVAAAIMPAVTLAAQQGQPNRLGGASPAPQAAQGKVAPTGGVERVPVVQEWPEISESPV